MIVQKWLKEEFRLKKMAVVQREMIYFGDAASIRSDHQAGRTWSKKDEMPVVEAVSIRHSMSLLSAITHKGHMRFMIKEHGGVNAAVFIEFLKRLLIGAKKPVVLIVDRSPAHVAKKTKTLVETLNGKLRLFYLPL